jgi:conjugation system TraG family ATPase
MMERQLAFILPIWGVEKDCIVATKGDYTAAFEVTKPEIFTLSGADYENMHQTLVKAIKVLPANCILHFQDWYTGASYAASPDRNTQSFLDQASDRFFEGRPYLDHRAYLYITRRPSGRKGANSASSNLFRKTLVPEEALSPTAVREFRDSVGQFWRILEDGKQWQLRRLAEGDIWSTTQQAGLLEQYIFLASPAERPVIRDIAFDPGMRVGDRHCQLYTLADAEKLPAWCSPRIAYDQYSTDKTKFPIGFAAGLGSLLQCNHIYNQYVFLEDAAATLKKLEAKRLRLQSLSKGSRENAIAEESVNAFLNEAIKEQRLPVKWHANVLAWTENPNELGDIKNRVSSAIAQLEAAPHQETVGAAQIWYAGIPGNAGDFPMNETVDTFAEQALCFLNMESPYRSSEGSQSIRFGDRITGKPVQIDLFHGPMAQNIITNRGAFVCGGSGGGKSMLCNHIFRSLYEQGAHILIVDLGGSYKGLCALVGGYYFTYTETDPIRFNPFFLAAGEALDTEKKESLKALLVTLWKQEHETFNRSEYVALSNALQGYYARLENDATIYPCFNSFYEYLQSDYVTVLQEHRVKDRDFDIENFLYVLRPYYRGGEFDYLLNATENLGLLSKRFIVFELDNIKDNPILLPVVSLIIMELTISKMRKIPAILKAFAIEEAWKPMMQAGMSQFMKYAWKTFRKLYGIPIVVTQEIDDLVSSPIIKEAIIGNSDIKILMDMRKFMNKFDALQATLGMSEKGKTLLFSVNRANEPGRRYREFYLELGGQVQKVFRFEPSPEEYYAYTTEGKEKVMVMEYAAKYGSVERGITALVADLKAGKKLI